MRLRILEEGSLSCGGLRRVAWIAGRFVFVLCDKWCETGMLVSDKSDEVRIVLTWKVEFTVTFWFARRYLCGNVTGTLWTFFLATEL